MSDKNDLDYIGRMLDTISRIDEYVESKQHFFQSRLVQDAVIRNLQVMSESSQKLSVENKKNFPEIPWKNISGFRNILVHDYLGVDVEMIWSVVDQELPKLQQALAKMASNSQIS